MRRYKDLRCRQLAPDEGPVWIDAAAGNAEGRQGARRSTCASAKSPE